MEKSEWDVHITHCCALHGCKYCNEDCPVTNALASQEYMCEECEGEVVSPIFSDKPIIVNVSILDGLNIFFNVKKFLALESETKLNVDKDVLEVGSLIYIKSDIETQEEVISETNFISEQLDLSKEKKNYNIENVKNLLENSNKNKITWKCSLISSIEKYGDLTIVSITS